MVMRFDLTRPEHERALAEDVVARLGSVGATATVLACYTDAPARVARLARAPLVRAIRRRLAACGIELVEALLVRHGRWWSYTCTDVRCCPWEGTPLSAALTPAAALYAAESVAQGAALLPGRDVLVASIEPAGDSRSVARRAAAATAAVGLLAGVSTAPEGADLVAAGALALVTLQRLVDQRSQERYRVSAEDAAVIALGLHEVTARDLAMTMVLDCDDDGFVALLTDIARQVDDVGAAPVCTVLAWASYSRGGGALASVAAERALRCEPCYPLAELVLEALGRMVPPSEIRDLTQRVRAVFGG
jgi:hypothetical protein